MPGSKTISVFEYGWLVVGCSYGLSKTVFTDIHYKLLNRYLTQNPDCGYFSVYFNRIRFCNYVGVIHVGDVTVEVLPKIDKHISDKSVWQKILVDMLAIALHVDAQTTTFANIQLRQFNVLETYLSLFLSHAETLIHQGLVKKYRTKSSNQNALKGKLLFQKQISENQVHAERFYISHQIYDRNNIYNSILPQTMQCIQTLSVSMSTSRLCLKLLLDFPECSPIKVSHKLFQNLSFDRKTERYKTAIELAKIILLNYHPDVKGGNENILAIMFDMNLLWESYIYAMILKSKNFQDIECKVEAQKPLYFWQHPDKWSFRLIPDLVVTKNDTKEIFILDTKWKYNRDTAIEDIRQMYAYGKYFEAKKRYLLYPEKLDDPKVMKQDGKFYDIIGKEPSDENICGLIHIDLLTIENKLNREIGKEILSVCFK